MKITAMSGLPIMICLLFGAQIFDVAGDFCGIARSACRSTSAPSTVQSYGVAGCE
jgi:hypothetical protein